MFSLEDFLARNCPVLIRKDCNKVVAKVIREGMKAAERVRGYCTRPKDNSNRPGVRIGRGKERKKKKDKLKQLLRRLYQAYYVNGGLERWGQLMEKSPLPSNHCGTTK